MSQDTTVAVLDGERREVRVADVMAAGSDLTQESLEHDEVLRGGLEDPCAGDCRATVEPVAHVVVGVAGATRRNPHPRKGARASCRAADVPPGSRS